jgi:hypothetical protein
MVTLGGLEGSDGSSRNRDDGGGELLDAMKMFLHCCYVITVSLAGRCSRQTAAVSLGLGLAPARTFIFWMCVPLMSQLVFDIMLIQTTEM